jgi:uncharacterized protein (DUF2147 family)
MRSLLVAAVLCLIGSAVFAQSDITGTWNTGMENTMVLIEKQDDVYRGKIVSSDNEKVKEGTLILKDVEHIIDEELEGKMFSLKKGEWFDAKIINTGDKLDITVGSGIRKKSVEWVKSSNN